MGTHYAKLRAVDIDDSHMVAASPARPLSLAIALAGA
jgi:hypothetical protein